MLDRAHPQPLRPSRISSAHHPSSQKPSAESVLTGGDHGAPGAAGVGTGISRFNQGAARPGAFRVSTCPRGCTLLRHLHGRSPHSRGSASLRSPHFGICAPLGCACCLQPSHAAPQHVHPSVWHCPPQQAPSLHGHTPRQVHGLAGTRHCRCHQ